jgi:hypothetical protein
MHSNLIHVKSDESDTFILRWIVKHNSSEVMKAAKQVTVYMPGDVQT